MKTSVLLFLIVFPYLLRAQIHIILPVTQNPLLGYSMTKADTTIEKGGSAVLGSGLTISGGSGVYNYLWSPSATLNDPKIPHPTATPADTTDYQLTVTDGNGCSFSAHYKVNVKNSAVLSDLLYSPEPLRLALFPNPGKGDLTVRLQGIPQKRVDIWIVNSEGQIFHRYTIKNFEGEYAETLRLNLAGGIYTLKVLSGNNTLSRLFVIN